MSNFRKLEEVASDEYELFNAVWTIAGTTKNERIANVNRLLISHISRACANRKTSTKSLESNSMILHEDLQINLIVKDSTWDSDVFTGVLESGDYSSYTNELFSGKVVAVVKGIDLSKLLTSDDVDYQLTVGTMLLEATEGDVVTDTQMIFRTPEIINLNSSDHLIKKLINHQEELSNRLCSKHHSISFYTIKENGCWVKHVNRYYRLYTSYTNFSQFLSEIQEDLMHVFSQEQAGIRVELNIAQYVGGKYIDQCIRSLFIPRSELFFLKFVSTRQQGVKVRKDDLLSKHGKLNKMIDRHPEDEFIVYLFESVNSTHYEYVTRISYNRLDSEYFSQCIKERFEDDFSNMTYDLEVFIPTDSIEMNAMYQRIASDQREMINQRQSEVYSNFMKAR
ncbi:hypothetical protein N7E81_07190 [Reichenbachiella carrageenanivorans]|uniref:Uncharacterized protein n=1 Tax=Reichenbachiella carrageenanivorans TaxID=2979869 RepID=A0ABY6D6X8_9BACT|nr:hypothetical protein [Reichenbachiella carrageenanivorans]UXX80883.1 hypothetical protein N7E81_07190 [Reichenbachiella carrageenanivorans]